MTRSDRPAPHGPRRRGDSPRPHNARPNARRGADRRPYPTASTTTRISPANPDRAAATSRSQGTKATPIPATVWAAGDDPIDLNTAWPTPIVATIVTSFTAVGARVVLLPQATTTGRRSQSPVGADGVITHAPGAEPDPALADALATIDSLDRTGQAVHVAADSRAAHAASRPFWADLVGGPDTAPQDRAAPTPAGADANTVDDTAAPVSGADLIIASLPPQHTGDHTSDLVAQVAARWLRVGGILAVLTHCDWSRGELIDPTGAMVASAQNADLLYLQHIVALHTPIRTGHVDLALGDAALDQAVRARHRAVVRGLPSPHRRVHSDVLVFANPHDHQSPRPAPVDAAFQTGVIR